MSHINLRALRAAVRVAELPPFLAPWFARAGGVKSSRSATVKEWAIRQILGSMTEADQWRTIGAVKDDYHRGHLSQRRRRGSAT